MTSCNTSATKTIDIVHKIRKCVLYRYFVFLWYFPVLDKKNLNVFESNFFKCLRQHAILVSCIFLCTPACSNLVFMHHQRTLRKQELVPYIYLNLHANRTQCDVFCTAVTRGINNYVVVQIIRRWKKQLAIMHFLKGNTVPNLMCPETIHVSCIPWQIYIHQSVTSVLIFLLSAMFKVLSCRQRWWAVRVIPAHHFDGR